MIGEWEEIDKYHLLVNCPVLDSASIKDYQLRVNEVKPGEAIDWNEAKENFSLVMPYMVNDTLRFTKKYKSLVINSFEFKRKK